MRELNPQFVVFSAELNHLTTSSNKKRTNEMETELIEKNIPFKRVLGSYRYKDNSIGFEDSFLVFDQFDKHRSFIWGLIADFNQESLLHVNEYRQARLYYGNGNIDKIGKFCEISASDSIETDAFTYDSSTGKYFTCK